MHAWPQETEVDPPSEKPASATLDASALFPALSGQLVAILANMVLAAREEVPA